MVFLLPGTYKIIDEDHGTCITDRNGEAVHWRMNNHKDQEWYLQRSGEGHFLRNCQSGRYLTVNIINGTTKSIRVFCDTLPTEWELSRTGVAQYMKTTCGETALVLHIPYLGVADGSLLYAEEWKGAPDSWGWMFERLSLNTGEQGEQDLSKEQETTSNPTLLAKENRELASQLAEKDRRLGETIERLADLQQELAKVRGELAEKSSRLEQTEDALRKTGEQLASQDARLSRIREQLDGDNLQGEISQWKRADEKRVEVEGYGQFKVSRV
ncbi:hypothetical protein FRC08_018600 [Ceratobasidium sp. 394]|nr:hypothetical protein FRC08_018600 [Ceratobasidium sp. 394]